MGNKALLTWALLMFRKNLDMLVVTRDADENHNIDATDLSKRLSEARVFVVSSMKLPTGGYYFSFEGELLNWGLHYAVGVLRILLQVAFGAWTLLLTA